MRGEVVLEIEHPDQLGLLQQGQAEDRAGVVLTDVLICEERILCKGIIKDHALPRPDHRSGAGIRGARPVRKRPYWSQRDFDSGRGRSRRFRCDLRLVPSEQDEQAPLGARMLDCDPQECLDELAKFDLARHGLRSLQYRPDIQLLDGCANRRRRQRWRCFFAQPRVALVELFQLAERPPARKASSCILQMGACGGRGPAAKVKSCSKLVGDSFVLDEAVLAGRSNGLLVQTHCVGVSSFKAGDLGRHQGVLASANVGR